MVQSLKDILELWLESSPERKVFHIAKNLMTDKSKETWFIWYQCWAALEIFDDRVDKLNGYYQKEIHASSIKFFDQVSSYLFYNKRCHDEWWAKQKRWRVHDSIS